MTKTEKQLYIQICRIVHAKVKMRTVELGPIKAVALELNRKEIRGDIHSLVLNTMTPAEISSLLTENFIHNVLSALTEIIDKEVSSGKTANEALEFFSTVTNFMQEEVDSME
jgi:hypothetical protein